MEKEQNKKINIECITANAGKHNETAEKLAKRPARTDKDIKSREQTWNTNLYRCTEIARRLHNSQSKGIYCGLIYPKITFYV